MLPLAFGWGAAVLAWKLSTEEAVARKNAGNTGPTKAITKASQTDWEMRRASAGAPVKKGTAQKTSQAKGLVDKVGSYGNKKTLNLTKKQLGASGVKAASTRKIAISRTEYRDGKVYGPMGKPITGRVDMGGGNIAVYRKGVRVKASAAKPSSPDKPKPPSAKPVRYADVDRPSRTPPSSTAARAAAGAAANVKARSASAARNTAAGRSGYVWSETSKRWIPAKRGSK